MTKEVNEAAVLNNSTNGKLIIQKDKQELNNLSMETLYSIPFFNDSTAKLNLEEWSDKETEKLFPELQHLFGITLQMKVHTKIVNMRNKVRLFGTVVSPLNKGGFENPLTPGTLWEVSVQLTKEKANIYKQGDIISFQYKPMLKPEKKEHYIQLIQPLSDTVEIAPIEIDQLYGPSFATALEEKVGKLDSEFFDGLYKIFNSNFTREIKALQKKHRKEQEKLDEAIKKLKETKDQKETMEDQINQLRDQLTQKRHEHEEALNLIAEEFERAKKQHEVQLAEERNKYRVAFQRLQLIPPSFVDEVSENSNKSMVSLSEFNNPLNAIRAVLYQTQELSYEHHVLARFLTGLKTNQLILLSGPSGTGKSSLIRGLSKIIKNVKTTTVRVQSSWTDKQDLLGFYNPIERRFIATPFLDALADAQQDQESLYLICLDEMNLSHVEYYFAELLSAREDDIPILDLYSKRDYETARKILEQADTGKYDTKDLQNAADLVHRYQAKFNLPPNVRFIGTMNMDETVKPVSPKVIDRSFVIELRHPDKPQVLEQELQMLVQELGVTDNMVLEINVEEDIYNPYRSKEVDDIELIKNQLIDLNPMLNKLNAQLNKRAIHHLQSYLSFVPEVMEGLDHLILSKILPRIRFSNSNIEKLQAFQTLCDSIQTMTNDEHILRKIDEMKEAPRLVSYWG
jgi:energy-coupling factor transporter ATP-binding protein EcfA2/PHD/YefM family antitoxin component YafN of YafNO toxin-antitoxin module